MAAPLGLIVAAVDVEIERLSDALSNVDVVCLKKVSKISHGVSSRTALIPTANGSNVTSRARWNSWFTRASHFILPSGNNSLDLAGIGALMST
jgi:hypothetical protein